VAIELYNPYSKDIVLTAGQYRLAAVARQKLVTPPPGWSGSFVRGAAVNTDLLDLGDLPALTIPAYSYVLIDNVSAAGPVYYRPTGTGLPATGDPTIANCQYVSIPTLGKVAGKSNTNEPAKELYIICNNDPAKKIEFDEPIDSFDFASFIYFSDPAGVGFTPTGRVWHYARANATNAAYSATDPQDQRWLCVYPGRYDGSTDFHRHQGTQTNDALDASDAFTFTPALSLGAANTQGTIPAFLPIQIGNMDFPNPVVGSGNKVPFGGFLRDGDILKVPYIAACTFTNATKDRYVEMNSVSMDAAFAEDSTPNDDYPNYVVGSTPAADPAFAMSGAAQSRVREAVGRFCPIRSDDSFVDDFGSDPTKYRYAWATDLFDYLTAQSPASDYSPSTPNVQTYSAAVPVDNDGDGVAAMADYPGASDVGTEDSLSVHGKINLNTAPWMVLSAIPWMPAGDQIGYGADTSQPAQLGLLSFGPNGVDDNVDIARAIVGWRDGDIFTSVAPGGPFKTIFDLYKVTDRNGARVFEQVQNQLYVNSAADPSDAIGDFTPYDNPASPPAEKTDHSRYDFEEQYLLLTKVSNLITTRSDSFTVYIVVQGWQGVGGTTMPKLVVQRRAAFIQDRSTATRGNPNLPAAVNVPND
jgi:hypothetical protein